MSKRILTAILLGLAVASHGVLAQDTDTVGRDQSIQQQDEQKYWNDLTPNYHNDDSPNYPFTA
jgi:hypothetical protein